jgi:hypothetical protein
MEIKNKKSEGGVSHLYGIGEPSNNDINFTNGDIYTEISSGNIFYFIEKKWCKNVVEKKEVVLNPNTIGEGNPQLNKNNKNGDTYTDSISGEKYSFINDDWCKNITEKDKQNIVFSIVDITYKEIIEKINNSFLTPGSYYKILDTIEPFIVFSLNNKVVSTDIQSTSYPQDTIKYDIVNNKITYRKDTLLNIECYYDWRNSNTFPDREVYNISIGINSYNNIIKKSCNNISIGDNSSNNIFEECCEGNILGEYCSDNIFGKKSCFNTIGEKFNSNIIKEGFTSNIIGNKVENNTFDFYFINNIIGNTIHNNKFGNNLDSNKIGNEFHNNIIGNQCKNNVFSNQCYFNNIVDNVVFTNFTLLQNFNLEKKNISNLIENYICDVYKNSKGTYKLKYYDDSLIIIDLA